MLATEVATVKFMNETTGQIILMDDISPILNSRSSNTKENKNSNILMTVGRTSNHIVVRTFPFNFMTEKYIRHLGNYLIEMQKQPNLFPYGYSSAKIFSIETNRDGSEPYNAYLQNHKQEKYLRAFFRKPSQNIIDIYTERRANAKKILDEQAIATLTKIAEPNEEKEHKIRKSDVYREIYEKFTNGEYGTMSLVKVCETLDVPYNQVKQCSFTLKHKQE